MKRLGQQVGTYLPNINYAPPPPPPPQPGQIAYKGGKAIGVYIDETHIATTGVFSFSDAVINSVPQPSTTEPFYIQNEKRKQRKRR